MILDIYRKAYDARYKPCEHAAAHLAGLQAVAEAVRAVDACREIEQLEHELDVAKQERNAAFDRADAATQGSESETDTLVGLFAVALKAKLRTAEAKYGWQNGWLKDDWKVKCQYDLMRHVGKGDPLDVAAYAAFCWHHGWPTASQLSTTFVTGAVEPTAAAIAAYSARYPDGTLSETSDNVIECWNRVAAATCLAGQSAGTGVMEALRGIADDYMTSERHHPGYVLIPAEKFDQLREAAEALAAPEAQGGAAS